MARFELGRSSYEVGHWRLHRGLFYKDPTQTSLLDDNAPPGVICRSSQAKSRIELQADLYASCGLMPRKLVFAAWDEAFPDREQRVLQPSEPLDHPFIEIARLDRRVGTARISESDDKALDSFATATRPAFGPWPSATIKDMKGLLHNG